MIYTFPYYYNHFKCTVPGRPDTCCAGWGTMINSASLKKYRNTDGPFGSRFHNSIHWREGSSKQYYERCAFLNEENLCDIYSEAGPEYLCRTCRTYPRHIEELEGCREMTLCLSCIRAATIILGCEEPVRFLIREDERQETYKDFDFFLFTKLMDARESVLDILRDCTWSWEDKTSVCLGLAHDLQARIRKGRLYETDGLIERYRRAAGRGRLPLGWDRASCSKYGVMEEAFSPLSEMEVLGKGWPAFVSGMKATLYGKGRQAYEARRRVSLESEVGKRLPVFEEQLMVYFVFTYFCGAIYNGNPYGKMKMAAAATLLIEELAQALWTDQGDRLTSLDFVDGAHQFSWEVEHSDSNKAVLEEVVVRRLGFALRRLPAAVESDGNGEWRQESDGSQKTMDNLVKRIYNENQVQKYWKENKKTSECNHDCGSYGANCDSRKVDKSEFLEALNPTSSAKKVIGVVSDKGGVGKSLVTSMLAMSMNREGKKTAVLDADIMGPSIPMASGTGNEGVATPPDGKLMFLAKSMEGVKVTSANLLLDRDTDPVIWKGPVTAGAMKQFWSETLRQDVDYMFVDISPGTGDVPLIVFQSLPVDGIIIVILPQELVGVIMAKAVNMAKKMDIPIVGAVENTSYLERSDCGKRISVFGEGYAGEIAAKYGIKVLAQIPIDPVIVQMVDTEWVEYLEMPWFDEAVKAVEVL